MSVRADKPVPLGRLLVPPPKGLNHELARLIDALAREQARRDHLAENPAKPLAAPAGARETSGPASDAA